ncbi:MAG: hypothetical protein MJE63_33670 [Proteobacteria bacterium]|nr:hypothetical protein [Pseudomonadota bacterium]
MLKKLLFTSICAVALATSGYAVELKINADVEAYFKQQTDHRTPLDSADWLESNGGTAADRDDGNNFRSGANNRSSQNVRAHGNVDFIGLAGENDFDGTTWYNFIGFMRLTLDANDPDDNEGSNQLKDGNYVDKASIGDLWVRYSPAAMVGIKVGTQTVAATANAYGIGHKFVGDKDDDYIYYTAAVLDEKPGITVDLHLSKDIELGAGLIQGMGDLSAIISGGSSAEARATVAWFKGDFGLIEATVGYQTIAVGDTEPSNDTDPIDNVISKWKHEYTHTIMNAVLKVNIGDFSPFIGYQSGSGEAAKAKDSNAALSALIGAANYARLNNQQDGTVRDVTLSSMTVGLLANLGPGKLAAEYTIISSPEWGEDDYVQATLEADSTIHVNYQFPIADGATITAFYNAFTAKEDDKLREDIEFLEGLTANDAANAIAGSIYTSHSSIGLSFQMKYGN